MTNGNARGPACMAMIALVLIVAAPVRAAGAEPANASAAPNAVVSVDTDLAGEGPDGAADAASPAAGGERDLVVTASRLPEPKFDAPFFVDTVGAERILDRMYRTSVDLFQDIPGLMVQKTGYGQGSPYIRGFTGYHNLLMVDGVRLNNAVFRAGPNQYWNTVDALSIDHLEIVQGPGSVLYGSDAVGGTVNAFTKGPVGYGEGYNYGGRLYYRLSSAERSQVGRAEAWSTWDHTLGIYVGGSVKEFGDLEGGRNVNTQRDTGYDEWDGDFKVEYFLAPKRKLVFAHQHVQQFDAPRTHKTIGGLTWEGLARGNEFRRDLDQRRDLTYFQYHAEDLGGPVDAFHAGLSWHQQNETRHRARPGNRFDTQGFEVGTLGAFAQAESNTCIGRLAYGIDFYHDNVNSFSTGNPIQGPVGDDANYDRLGMYLQNTISLCDRFDVIVGGRYEYARARAGSVQDPNTGLRIRVADSWSSVVGSGRVAWHVDRARHWNVFAGVGQSFRAPNLSDLARLDTARTNELETPAPGLDPEHFLTYEVGTKAEYEDFELQFAYFYTVIRDMIVRTPTGVVFPGPLNEVTKQNAGDGFVQGIEIAPRWRFADDWMLFGWLAWIDGQVDTFPTAAPVKRREPIDRLMPTNGQVGLRWDSPNRRVWAEAVCVWADEADDLSTRDMADTSRIPPGGTPGYVIGSLRVGWRVRDNVTLTLGVENITDEDYRIHGSGQNEPGRNVVLGLEMTF